MPDAIMKRVVPESGAMLPHNPIGLFLPPVVVMDVVQELILIMSFRFCAATHFIVVVLNNSWEKKQ